MFTAGINTGRAGRREWGGDQKRPWTGWFTSLTALALALLCAASLALADDPTPQPASPSPGLVAVPASRAARNLAVITVEGEIDEWTYHSVARRIKLAKELGADGLVIEVNSPGGEIVSCILISTAIKNSPFSNTAAWVNPMAYSGGAIISLACKEVFIADGAALGDAIPIAINRMVGAIERLPTDEREKLMGPVIADLVDSARRNGYDEMLVQGFVRRGVELWLVEHNKTGDRLFVTEAQYKAAVGEDPPERLSPTVRSGSGPVNPKAPSTPRADAPRTDVHPKDTDVAPAAPNFSPTLAGDINQELSLKGTKQTERPDFARPENQGQYKYVEYVSDGTGVLTLRESELFRYNIAAKKVRSDDELKVAFGATTLIRLDENWADITARFLSHPWVKIFLIVVFLVAIFVEMMHPGVSFPGAIAAVCLVGLVLPSILAGIAGWWALGAIVAGILLVCVELFVMPGVIVFGVLGVLLLFSGLVGTFLVSPGGTFPGSGKSSGEVAWAVASTLVSLVSAGVVIGILLRFLPRVPLLNRLVLVSGVPNDDMSPDTYAAPLNPDHPINPGMTGTSITPLRPAGRVEVGDRIVDAVAEGAFIDAGTPIRVLSSTPFRTTVERA